MWCFCLCFVCVHSFLSLLLVDKTRGYSLFEPLSLCTTHHTHTHIQRCQEGGEVPKETRKFIFSSVTDIGRVAPPPMTDHVAHSLDCMEFVCLLRSVLVLDPLHRAGPAQALQSPFITMQHLALHTNTQR